MKKIEKELEKCNVVVAEGLSHILERGEIFSEPVVKSENLSVQTKILFKTAKKKNSCCYIHNVNYSYTLMIIRSITTYSINNKLIK